MWDKDVFLGQYKGPTATEGPEPAVAEEVV